jgi:hypothetical protein
MACLLTIPYVGGYERPTSYPYVVRGSGRERAVGGRRKRCGLPLPGSNSSEKLSEIVKTVLPATRSPCHPLAPFVF